MKTKRLYIITVVILLFLTEQASTGQAPLLFRSTVAGGGAPFLSVRGDELSGMQSIGQQSVTGVYQRGTFILQQGFLLPRPVLRAGLKDPGLILKVYPNPFRESLYVDLQEQVSGATRVSIYDLTGRLLILQNISGQKAELDTGMLQAGVYLLAVRSGEQESVMRIVKSVQ